ncbi:MAG: cold-shock protein [Ignavibacteria bacterium]|jgi:CspA family cold shock protein|nr:cold-shock protein [Ignavibacteria bacterium]MBS1492140.1 cold-shock protein [Bacteroidota bacterium]
MPKGKVKWFDAKKGYGFLVGDDGTDVFIHYSDISTEQSYKTLDKGVSVEYDLIEDQKGKKAANVRAI